MSESPGWVKKGQKWPSSAATFPRHPDWLTVAEAAALLGVTARMVRKHIYDTKVLSHVTKKWRYGCWVRRATFVRRDEVEALRAHKLARKPGIPMEPPNGAPTGVLNVNPLRSWRKLTKTKVRDVARAIKVTEGTVGRWEMGQDAPADAYLGMLAALMETTLDDLRMRWTAWRVLMMSPVPAKRVPFMPLDRLSPAKAQPEQAEGDEHAKA